MVSQQNVELAMNEIGEPCTTADIADFLLENKIIEPVNWDIKIDIATVLKMLQKWEIVDRLPQGHTKDKMVIWYMRKNGHNHDEYNCRECKLRRDTHNLYLRQFLIREEKNRYVIKDPEDDLDIAGWSYN